LEPTISFLTDIRGRWGDATTVGARARGEWLASPDVQKLKNLKAKQRGCR
jgi:hypothetical protein